VVSIILKTSERRRGEAEVQFVLSWSFPNWFSRLSATSRHNSQITGPPSPAST